METIKAIIVDGEKQLAKAGVEDAASCARLLCCYVMDVPMGRLPLLYGEAAEPEVTDRYAELVARKAAGEPLQYITGEVSFMGFDMKVDERALIPRPETELLVEEALKWLETEMWRAGRGSGALAPRAAAAAGCGAAERENRPPHRILDLCCGSGAIGLTLARLQDIPVTLTDISPEALTLAKENAERLGLSNVTFLRGNLFEPLKDQTFDLILSNPPYIPSKDIQVLQREVKDHEPLLALDGGKDGLDIYRKIITEAPLHLSPGGALMMEIGYDQAEAISELVRHQDGLREPDIIKDMAGRDRILVTGRREL